MSKFKELLAKLGVSQEEFSKEIGITYGSFRTMTAKQRLKEKKPSWMKAFLLGVEKGQGSGVDVTNYEE